MSHPKERYEEQFAPCTVPIRLPGLAGFQRWYMTCIKAAFDSGITTGW